MGFCAKAKNRKVTNKHMLPACCMFFTLTLFILLSHALINETLTNTTPQQVTGQISLKASAYHLLARKAYKAYTHLCIYMSVGVRLACKGK